MGSRFVILHHTGYREDHYDFMLERDGVLKTWTIHALDFTRPQKAVRNFDHRIAYLDYEGEISGGRGAVKRVRGGEYTVESESIFVLEGVRIELRPLQGEVWELGPA
jgi:hypothetical protein